MNPLRADNYDLAFVGSGIACTMTLLELSALLMDKPPGSKPLKVAIIEKEGEFWNGIAYGGRSAVSSLAITSLLEFVDEPGRSSFIEWLQTNQPRWLAHLGRNGGPAGNEWIKSNQPLIQNGNWDEIFLPRFVYGLYNSEKLAARLAELQQQGLADVTLIQAEAVDLASADEAPYEITLEVADGGNITSRAERVVLAIGSPPMNPLPNGTFAKENHHTYLNDIYCPSEEANLQRIHSALSAVPDRNKRNLLIVGSNASSLEILYLLNHRPDIRALANSIVIISRTGSLPHMICNQDPGFEFPELQLLSQKKSVSAFELISAIKADIKHASDAAINIADLFHPVSAVVGDLLKHMTPSEHERFFCEHGMTFTKMMRRAGREYREAADELAAAGLLVIEKGVFGKLGPSEAGSRFVSATYAKVETGADFTHPLPFAVVLNCGGFEELNNSSSRLIANLVRNNTCKINRTNRGFEVNDKFEANRNLYVIGPLLGGNFNDKIRFWHAESAPRIRGLSRLLAGCLFASLSGCDTSASQRFLRHKALAEPAGSTVCSRVQN